MHENQVDLVSLGRSLNEVVRIDGPVTSGKAPMAAIDEAEGLHGADNICTIKSPHPYAFGTAFGRNDKPQRSDQLIAHRGVTPSDLLRRGRAKENWHPTKRDGAFLDRSASGE
ncbi:MULTISPECIES: hypothetical protein [unclassified Bradyrhizobium]|uniref:hypothetical protein n=1 Tax=Bradyrhizobium sp. USDA 4541 TaxID=2817704 RepID=UPI0020A55FAE|nr:hypothetical protein [Bradyrhizobium sp. USDA 4541]MCP1854390.1 hypothetical protein [Bradyrhizobium sp. USDA 4541]